MRFQVPQSILDLNPRVVLIPEGRKGPQERGWPDTTTRAQDIVGDYGVVDVEGIGAYGIVLDADMLVIDIDVHGDTDGFDSFDRLMSDADIKNMPITLTVDTPSGGRHYYVSKSPDLKLPGRLSEFEGVDLLSKGKLVLGPGSNHPSGGVYSVISEGGMAPLPQQLETTVMKAGRIAVKSVGVQSAVGRPSGDPIAEFNKDPRALDVLQAAMESVGYSVHESTTGPAGPRAYVRPGKTDFSAFSISGSIGLRTRNGNFCVKSFSTSDSLLPSEESCSLTFALKRVLGLNDAQLYQHLAENGYAKEQSDEYSGLRESLLRGLKEERERKSTGTKESTHSDDEERDYLASLSEAEYFETRLAEREAAKKADDMSRKFEGVAALEEVQPIHHSQLVNSDDDRGGRREYVIEGLLRRGETMNLIAAPKTGKSFCVYNLASSLGSGKEWIGFSAAKDLKVLLCDNELHPEELGWRLNQVTQAVSPGSNINLDTLCLRGKNMDIQKLADMLALVVKDYDVIILDALYRFYPEGVDENSNSDMTTLYNLIDKIATERNCAIIVVHHTSKGDQSGKAVSDMGSGAGSISRAADVHAVIRPHAQDGLVCVDMLTRSSASPEPFSAKFDFPVWSRSETPHEPKQKASGSRKGPGGVKSAVSYCLDVLSKANDSLNKPEVLSAAKELGYDGTDSAISTALKKLVVRGEVKHDPTKPPPKKGYEHFMLKDESNVGKASFDLK